MLRARIHWGLNTVWTPPFCSSLSNFHTLHPLQETRRTRLARAAKKDNIEKRGERLRIVEHTKPDPVLGHRPGEEDRWRNSDLANVLVSRRELQSSSNVTPPLDTSAKPVKLPDEFQWGIAGDAAARHLLFDSLPDVSSQLSLDSFDVVNLRDERQKERLYKGQQQQLHNAHMFARMVDLRNASAAGIAFENRRRCIETFSTSGKPNDTGRPEVQAALFTMKIRKLWEHLQRNRKDIANRRSLRMLVHQRAKILKYLKRLDRQRYETVLVRLGIEEGAIEGELIVR